MMSLAVHNCMLHSLEAKGDERRGFLVALEGERNVPFKIARIYYIFGSQPAVERGLHAHRALRQWMICLNGAFSITVDDGRARETIELSRPDLALEIGSPVWREIKASGPEAVLMVLASEWYDEGDYIHEYREFLTVAGV